jgi:hypothetical protein
LRAIGITAEITVLDRNVEVWFKQVVSAHKDDVTEITFDLSSCAEELLRKHARAAPSSAAESSADGGCITEYDRNMVIWNDYLRRGDEKLFYVYLLVQQSDLFENITTAMMEDEGGTGSTSTFATKNVRKRVKKDLGSTPAAALEAFAEVLKDAMAPPRVPNPENAFDLEEKLRNQICNLFEREEKARGDAHLAFLASERQRLMHQLDTLVNSQQQ